MLAEFSTDDRDKIRALLELRLGHTWDSSNIGNAPELVRAVDDQFGGLWSGQLLFATDPTRDAAIFCTWWPWGDGKTISIRIGLEYKNLSDSDYAEKVRLFKGGFGV